MPELLFFMQLCFLTLRQLIENASSTFYTDYLLTPRRVSRPRSAMALVLNVPKFKMFKVKPIVKISEMPRSLKAKLLVALLTWLTWLMPLRQIGPSPEAIETGVASVRRLPEMVGAIGASIIVIYICYAIVYQVQQSLNVTPPGSTMLNTVWTFLALLLFAAVAGVIVGFFTARR